MKKAKLFGPSLIVLGLSVSLVACGGSEGRTAESDGGKGDVTHSAVITTNTGGADNKSFNQSSWKGLQTWGKEYDLPEGLKGHTYTQSNDAAGHTTNIDQAISSKFNTISGISYLLKDVISSAANTNPDTNFALISGQIDNRKDVVPATSRDNETAHLAGVVAVNETKTNKVGFVSGKEGVMTDHFQVGLEKGVVGAAKELGKEITVDTKYVASLTNPARGKALATAIHQNGVDIIFHASGATGQGAFQEIKDLSESGSGDKIWIIGVDRDQNTGDKYKTGDGKESDFTLTSTLKGIGTAVQDIVDRVSEDKFPSGERLVYGLKDGGADLTDGYLSDKTKEAIKTARDRVISGDVKIPEKPK